MFRVAGVLVLVGLLLAAGCAAPSKALPPPRPASSFPADAITAPEWRVGQSWTYRVMDGSSRSSQTWTVMGREVHNGRDSYRLEVALSEVDKYGAGSYTRWIDTETLGVIEERGPAYVFLFEPPGMQWFPMESREYDTSARFGPPPDPQERLDNHWRYEVYGWFVVTIPSGEQLARKVNITSTSPASPNATVALAGWYAPEVEAFVEFRDAGRRTFTLDSWAE